MNMGHVQAREVIVDLLDKGCLLSCNAGGKERPQKVHGFSEQ